MTRYCVHCGAPLVFDGPLEEAGSCPVCDAPQILELEGLGGQPPAPPETAPLHRRFGEGGIDFLALFALDVAGAVLAPLTLTASGVLPALVGAAYWSVRDLEGGRYSVGKRLTGLELVDAQTGKPATPQQALIRNSMYIVGWLLAAVPDPLGILGWFVLGLAVLVDVVLVVGHPSRRRLGDVLAQTEVRAVDGDD